MTFPPPARIDWQTKFLYLHTRAGYGGAALARFFKVPRTTAYEWVSWFESLPECLRDGIVQFMATQVPIMTACQGPDAEALR
jgi:hypothetical protein